MTHNNYHFLHFAVLVSLEGIESLQTISLNFCCIANNIIEIEIVGQIAYYPPKESNQCVGASAHFAT